MRDDKITSAFHTLANQSRRQLLVGISEEVKDGGKDCGPVSIVSKDEEPAVSEIELIHKHLPLLKERGYIEWDCDNQNIEKGPEWDEIKPIIELFHENRDELPNGWI